MKQLKMEIISSTSKFNMVSFVNMVHVNHQSPADGWTIQGVDRGVNLWFLESMGTLTPKQLPKINM